MAASTNGHTHTLHAAKGSGADAEQKYLSLRADTIVQHFPGALGVDDFLSRVEIALFQLGFNGNNSIGELGALARTSAAQFAGPAIV